MHGVTSMVGVGAEAEGASTYYVQGSVVHVRSPLGEKTTNVGMSPPEAIARLLLSELVREAKTPG
jgi:hypothetical protein